MKALYCRAFGPETDLTVEEIAAPVPAVGEVLVLVQAAGLNFPDLLCVRGEYQFKPPLPFVLTTITKDCYITVGLIMTMPV